MQKKILIILFLILLLFLISCKKVPTELAPPSNAKDGGISQISSTSYTCSVGEGGTGDFCDVQGFINNMDISSGKDVVAFRFDGDYKHAIYVDSEEQGYLIKWNPYITTDSTSCLGNILLSFKTPNNFIIQKGTTAGYPYLYICTGSQIYRYRNPTTGSFNTDSQYGGCPNSFETCKESAYYQVNWNFCPAGDNAFAYCDGANAIKTESQAWSGSTSEYRLNEGQLLQFDPKDGNNNPLPQDKFYIRIQKWDMSCSIDYTNKCDVNSQNVYCKCPSGYTFQLNEYCRKLNGAYIWKRVDNICVNSVNECVSLDSFQSCSSTNSNGCPIWSSTLQQCSDGKKCYVGDINKEGVGQCKCSPTECNKGDRRVSQLGGEYDECIQISSSGCDYNEWQSRTCRDSPELYYDPTTKKCVNKANDLECQPYAIYKKCVGNDLYSCVSNGIQDENGNYRWYINLETTCESSKECIDNGNFDYCGCKCTSGQIRCTSDSETEYELCGLNCWEIKSIPSGKLCKNNDLVDKSQVSCSEGGTQCQSGYTCNELTKTCINKGCYTTPTEIQCNTNIGEQCDNIPSSSTYNQCLCRDDNIYCRGKEGQLTCTDSKNYKQCTPSTTTCPYWSPQTITDSKICKNNQLVCPSSLDGNEWCDIVQVGTTRCNINLVEECMEYTNCYRWMPKLDTQNAGNGICMEGYVCVS